MPAGGSARSKVGSSGRVVVVMLCLDCRTEHVFGAAVPPVDGVELTFETPVCRACGNSGEWRLISVTPE